MELTNKNNYVNNKKLSYTHFISFYKKSQKKKSTTDFNGLK